MHVHSVSLFAASRGFGQAGRWVATGFFPRGLFLLVLLAGVVRAGAATYYVAASGNEAFGYGGGAYQGTLNSCTVSGNSANGDGGGACQGGLNNGTVSGNFANQSGGGVAQATLNNCIAYFNFASLGPNHDSATLNCTCTTPLPAGTGSPILITDPLATNRNYRVRVQIAP